MATQFSRARHLWAGLLTAVVALLAVLAWLGWRIAGQDEQLAAARRAASAESATDLAVATLDRRLAAIEQELSQTLQGGGPLHVPDAADAAVFVRFGRGTARVWPADHLAFVPDDTDAPAPDIPAQPDVDRLQYQRHDYRGAVAVLRPLEAAGGPHRAVYLARLAQNYLAAGDPQAALDAYARLSNLADARIAGMPAPVAGTIGMLQVHELRHDAAAARAAARSLDAALTSTRWRLTEASYEYLDRELSRRLPDRRARATAPARFADALSTIWDQYRRGERPATGRVALGTGSSALLVVWRAVDGEFAAYAADTAFVYQHWLGPHAASIAMSTAEGRRIAGPAPGANTHPAIRLASDTRLPWTVLALPTVDPQELAAGAARRRLLAVGMSVMLVLTLLCTAVVGRAVARELAVARLQSDFVSAVSHEFRTPLTTLCQLSELLERGRVPDEDVRHSYYRYLRTESERLRRLVEGLLTFGRLREGRAEFRFVPVDPGDFTRQCVSAFADAQASRPTISVEADGDLSQVDADADALGCALWNLLENAVKYSPSGAAVRVGVRRSAAGVAISVSDEGCGVHPSEQQRIFERFVRGRAASTGGVRGTGIGLATAREILRAHGGDVHVESDGTKGSTFTLTLPTRR